VDLRLKFGLNEIRIATHLHHRGQVTGDAAHVDGIVVDGVSEVLKRGRRDVEDTPDYGPGAALPTFWMAKSREGQNPSGIDQVLSSRDCRASAASSTERRRHRALRVVKQRGFLPPPAGGRPRLRE